MSTIERIANVTLIHGDCMDLLPTFDPRQFDLAIVDPPYFDGPNKSGYYGEGYSSLGVQRAKHYDSLPSWSIPDAEYFVQLKRVSADQIIWGANHFADRFNAASASWIVWDKVNGASSFADVELAYCSMDRAARLFRFVWNGMHQGSYGGDKRLNEPRIHPTQKPAQLYGWLLQKYSEPGKRVLDTHLGSASSAIAAIQLGMHFTGIEVDQRMFSAACRRVEAAQKQIDLFPTTTPTKAAQLELSA